MAKLVSKVYGDAVFELAVEESRVDELSSEVEDILKILDENTDLIQLLSHPNIVKEEKIKVVESCFKGKVSDELTGLLCILVEKSHSEEIVAVLNYFLDKVKEYKNIGKATVTSAVPLSEAQKASLTKRLLETTNYVEFEVEYLVDESLIGGLTIRIGDRVMDSSIKSQLYELKKELSKIQVSAI